MSQSRTEPKHEKAASCMVAEVVGVFALAGVKQFSDIT
jgi:hypothetical protein